MTIQLGRASLWDATTWMLAGVSLIVLLVFRINSIWLVLGGGLIGLLHGII